MRNRLLLTLSLVCGGCADTRRSMDERALMRLDSLHVEEAGRHYYVTVYAGETYHTLCDRRSPAFEPHFIAIGPGDSITEVGLYDNSGNLIKRFVEAP